MFAIIGPTASGKSDLALELAQLLNYEIFSIDSLSIYKEIDIASAKPSKEELKLVKHYGINEIYPNEHFNVAKLIEIFKSIKHKKLIIVGGSSFYLKTLIDGISPMPYISENIKKEAKKYSFEYLKKIDNLYASKINPYDSYRIQKGIEIYLATKTPPSIYFQKNPKIPIIKDLPIFEIDIDRDSLRKRIKKRTHNMIKNGLIDEVSYLEKKYKDRRLQSLKAIGIKEVLDYFNGKYNLQTLEEKISTNTAKLAKRQQIFNKTQFQNKISLKKEELKHKILKGINSDFNR